MRVIRTAVILLLVMAGQSSHRVAREYRWHNFGKCLYVGFKPPVCYTAWVAVDDPKNAGSIWW